MTKRSGSKASAPTSWMNAYRLHALLLLVLGLECAWALAHHRPTEQLENDLRAGTPADQVRALFVLTNRDVPRRVDRRFVNELLASDRAMLREWTMTTNFSRFGNGTLQRRYQASLGQSDEALRCRLLLTHQPGQLPWMTLTEVRAFLDTLR